MMTEPKRTILYAEDTPGDRLPVADFLRAHGFDVREVFDPTQAIAAMDERSFDLLLLDLIMPPGNPDGGRQVLRHMHKTKKSCPVILTTVLGYNGPARRLQAEYHDLVRDVITKRFESADLLAKIVKVLGGNDKRKKGKNAG